MIMGKKISLKKALVLAMATVWIVILLSLGISVKALCQSHFERKALNSFYLEKEKEYVLNVREYLTGKGYNNSGVMLTWVDKNDGKREYTMTINNSRFKSLSETEIRNLELELDNLSFQNDKCYFTEKISWE